MKTPINVKESAVKWFNSDKQRNILLIICIILGLIVFFSTRSCSNLKTDLNISNSNNLTLADSLRISKNKVGDLEYNKKILVTEKNDLKKLSDNLNEELKKEKGKVLELNYIIAHIGKVHDTIRVTNTLIKYPNGDYGLKWVYDTTFDKLNSRSINGVSNFAITDTTITPKQTLITKDDINFNIITGLKDIDGSIEIFVRSDYPGFKVTSIEGAIIDPKKNPIIKKYTNNKRWGIGPYVGCGIGSNLKPSAQIGIGIQYSFIKF